MTTLWNNASKALSVNDLEYTYMYAFAIIQNIKFRVTKSNALKQPRVEGFGLQTMNSLTAYGAFDLKMKYIPHISITANLLLIYNNNTITIKETTGTSNEFFPNLNEG